VRRCIWSRNLVNDDALTYGVCRTKSKNYSDWFYKVHSFPDFLTVLLIILLESALSRAWHMISLKLCYSTNFEGQTKTRGGNLGQYRNMIDPYSGLKRSLYVFKLTCFFNYSVFTIVHLLFELNQYLRNLKPSFINFKTSFPFHASVFSVTKLFILS
jgi:hypothetical protein